MDCLWIVCSCRGVLNSLIEVLLRYSVKYLKNYPVNSNAVLEREKMSFSYWSVFMVVLTV